MIEPEEEVGQRSKKSWTSIYI